MPFRVASNDVVIFLDNNPITGCFQYGLNYNVDQEQLIGLGESYSRRSIRKENQTHRLDLSWYFSPYSADIYLGGRSSSNTLYSSGNHNFIIRDTVEQQLISGAYLTRLGINFSVGDVPTCEASFDCDTIEVNNAILRTEGEDFFNHNDLALFSNNDIDYIDITPSPAIDDSVGDCVQSINIEIGISRDPVTRIGNRIPRTRRITNGDLNISVSIIKNKIKSMSSSYMQQVMSNIGTLEIQISNTVGGSIVISADNLKLESISDSMSIGDNEITTFNYVGKLSQSTFSIQT